MAQCYFTSRKTPDGPMVNLAADLMRHLFSRQFVGKAIIICERPNALISVSRKQWLKIGRSLQRDRSATINADRILTLTSNITHMQHLGFAAKSPEEHPQAHVFFVAPENFDLLPMNCATLYLTTPLSPARHRMLAKQLPADCLLVDYATSTDWAACGLVAKAELDLLVQQEWQNVLQFMKNEKIDLFTLSTNPYDSVALDDTLDILLAASHHFLQVTSTFFRAYERAQPFQSDPAIRKGYEVLGLLARKVDALTPGYFSQHLRRTYDEPEKFILFDNNGKAYRQYCQAKEIFRHRKAGRLRLAQALIGVA